MLAKNHSQKAVITQTEKKGRGRVGGRGVEQQADKNKTDTGRGPDEQILLRFLFYFFIKY